MQFFFFDLLSLLGLSGFRHRRIVLAAVISKATCAASSNAKLHARRGLRKMETAMNSLITSHLTKSLSAVAPMRCCCCGC
jgi:hypothetical protein